MKIAQEANQFKPVTLVIETREELDQFIYAFNHGYLAAYQATSSARFMLDTYGKLVDFRK